MSDVVPVFERFKVNRVNFVNGVVKNDGYNMYVTFAVGIDQDNTVEYLTDALRELLDSPVSIWTDTKTYPKLDDEIIEDRCRVYTNSKL